MQNFCFILIVFEGNLLSNLFAKLFGAKDMRILILGLDGNSRKKCCNAADNSKGAGKTTILYKLQCGEVITTIPST